MIKVKRSEDGQWYFVVISKNHKVLATSETYKRKANCMKGISAVQELFGNGYIAVYDNIN